MVGGVYRVLSIACLFAVSGLACSDSRTAPPVADGATESDTAAASDAADASDAAGPGGREDSAILSDAGPAKDGTDRTDNLPATDSRWQDSADAAAVADGNAGDAASISVTEVASSADLDAFLKAWCDWDVRCSSSYPTSLCDERRRGMGGPELYASQPMAVATACWPTLSCERYAEDCIQVAAMATAQSVPSRAALLSSCAKRDEECTGEGQLQLMDCYWFMLLSEPMQPQLEACMVGPCTQYRDCVSSLSQ
jgi:hypothetical protein